MKKRIFGLVLVLLLSFGVVMPAMAVNASELPYDEPELPYDEPELPYDEPELPYDEPELPYDEPELPYDEPELSYDESEKPELPYDESDLLFRHQQPGSAVFAFTTGQIYDSAMGPFVPGINPFDGSPGFLRSSVSVNAVIEVPVGTTMTASSPDEDFLLLGLQIRRAELVGEPVYGYDVGIPLYVGLDVLCMQMDLDMPHEEFPFDALPFSVYDIVFTFAEPGLFLVIIDSVSLKWLEGLYDGDSLLGIIYETAFFVRVVGDYLYEEPIMLAINDLIRFGDYEWRVLDVQEGKALIITEHVVFSMPFHNINAEVTWEESDIRRYLNNDFLFTFEEQDLVRIAVTYVVNAGNQWFGTSGGSNTTDRIFLLSFEEMARYFVNRGARRATNVEGIPFSYWLRSPGLTNHAAGAVALSGSLVTSGFNVRWSFQTQGGVRPALWLYLQP